MEGIVATLTDEEQARLRAIVKTGISAHGTRLAGVVGIHFHRHTAREHRFVGKVAMTYIDNYHVLMGFGCGRWHLQLKGDKQVELFPGLVIPQFCCPDMRTMLHESKMLLIARVADNDSPIEGEDAHLLIWFQAE